MYPATCDVLAVHDRVTECVVAVTPVPLTGIDRLGLVALLVTVMEPLALPASIGENVTVSDFVAPAARVKEVDTWASENPVPEMERPDTVTEIPAVLVSVTV